MKLPSRFLRRALFGSGAVMLAVFLAGCETTGLSTRESGHASYSQLAYEAARSQPAATVARPVRRPVRLAVAQVGEVAPPARMLAQLRDHPEMIATVISLPMPGDNRDLYARYSEGRPQSPDPTINRLEELRALARSSGADEVFVFGGSIDTRTSRNALAALDVTLVGMAIFPSAVIHAEGKAAGMLLDVTSGEIRFQVEAEQKKAGATPSSFTSEKADSVRVQLRDGLAANLTNELVRKLRDL